MPVTTRSARRSDAKGMCDVLNPIILAGGTTAHRTPFTEAQMIDLYIEARLGIQCVLAEDNERIVGFQSLEWCDPNWTGPEALPSDWGIIATYVAGNTHGRGIGRLLFHETVKAGRMAGVKAIDATIRHENTGGLAYYSRMGFVDYRQSAEACSKRFDLN